MEVRFRIGDKVYEATVNKVAKHFDCPDCLGKKEWECTSPAGNKYMFSCPRCGYRNTTSELRLDYFVWEAAEPRELTIGSVRTDTNNKEEPVTYMCVETGVGSGSVYKEQNFYRTDEAAFEASKIRAETLNKNEPSIKEGYLERLDVASYQLHIPGNASASKRAWSIIIQNLDESCGYDQSEIRDDQSIAKHVKRYIEAWDTLDTFFGAFK